ncbi:MAG: DUF1330 domain-containing protein, partial [Proteobacteria bacterium]|nr:DUF1330 domain-containing protein [Candidatus Fonsibacter sp. PEL5]
KAYWIAKYKKIDDLKALGKYAEKAKKVIESFGGRALVRGGKYIIFEGENFIRTVIWEFENIDIANKCHDSNDYQEAWALAKNTTVRDLLIVEGV